MLQLFQYLQNHPIDIWNGSQECDEEKLLADIVMERDSATDLFYTLWNGRRLYFPRGSEPDVNKQYVLSILKEQLPTSPHCYCQSDVYVEKGDVIVDAGAAEGFWALDQADKAGHIFLIECSEAWIEALKATFAPYREKTTIIPKFLGGVSGTSTITLEDIQRQYDTVINFVKMDIEGAEAEVFRDLANSELLNNNLKFLVAAYHHHGNAEKIANILLNRHFAVHYSSGYMWFPSISHFWQSFELRHAVVCAKHIP